MCFNYPFKICTEHVGLFPNVFVMIYVVDFIISTECTIMNVPLNPEMFKWHMNNQIHSWKKGCPTHKLWHFWGVSHWLVIFWVSPRQSFTEFFGFKMNLPSFGLNVYFQTMSEKFGIFGKMKFHRIWRFELSGFGQNVTIMLNFTCRGLNYRFSSLI